MSRKAILLSMVLIATVSEGSGAGHPAAEEAQKPAPQVAKILTPELLGMDRTQIVFSGRRLRLFNGRGTVSVRDWSVTGLQVLQFPPIYAHDYHFQLAFRDERNKVSIQDLTADAHEQLVTTGKGSTPLGFNFISHSPFVMLLQREYWQPNLYVRTGTFHKVFDGHWVSFGIRTQASVSAEKDEIYLEVEIHNRHSEPLVLTVIAQQSAPELTAGIPKVSTPPPSAVRQLDAFTLGNSVVRVTAVSDLGKPRPDGWAWEIPAQAARTARFAIIPQPISSPAPDPYAPDLAERITRADHALRARLEWTSENLPRISSADQPLNDLYYRSVLSVLESRWERENFFIQPFYAAGTWLYTTAWDTSYASELLSLLDPKGLREAFLAFLRSGSLTCTYIPWNGKAGEFAYAQDPFAKLRILQDYLIQTGDAAFLDRVENGATVYAWMKRMAVDLKKQRGRPDGLLDFGSNSNNLLEIRTDGYEHVVAATNGLAAEYFQQVADWGRGRNDPEAEQLAQWAGQLKKSLNDKLWNEQAGWFDNLFPDGSRQQVWSYHLFDILNAGLLSERQRQRLVGHIREGEFLGPYGMYSIAKSDDVHWDLMDEDWGGGGQYTGMPLRIAETLYRLGYSELGWNILARCARWTERYPYLPQDAFTDSIGDLDEEDMPLEIAAGSGAQAILFGVFGLRPTMDGSLAISPAYHTELGEATMAGYHFRGHTYDVAMMPGEYYVYRDGKLAARNAYGIATSFPKP
jgi:hypothetical protein